ncbi:MAG: hypothetical protein IKY44_05415 [Clostridia bacterium]|nr:hypothetical protein [Clostridia bacterium]
MKKKSKFRIILTCVGIALIVCAVGLFAYSQIRTRIAKSRAKEIVAQLYSLMPEVTSGAPDDRSDPTMPMLQIDGQDFVGIVEIPTYSKALPIYGKWDASRVSKYPCRYLGSVYSDTLIIGGSDNDGQLDFVKEISNGDNIHITDTTGIRYKYVVFDINRTKDVSTQYLTKTDARLVLFARNTYSLDYTVIYCSLA